MGNSLGGCRSCTKKSADNSVVILLAGLDNAGKTRTVGLLVGNGAGSEAPTVGFQPAQLRYRNRIVHLHDVGGCDQFRRAWRHYYADAHGLIFVVDSADRARLQECARVLEEVLAHPHISGKPVLILANKQDLKGAMDDLDIVERLNVEAIVNRYKCPTRVESYSASIPKGKSQKRHIDPGLKKGYEWLLNYIIHKYGEINLKVKNDVSNAMNRSTTSEIIVNDTIADASTTTGFDNPNYKIDRVEEDSEGEEGIIVVKQAPNTITKANGNVKLSPLFGGKNDDNDFGKKSIELEVRTHMRKLSPISKHRVFVASSLNKTSSSSNANEIFANQLKKFKSQESLNEITNSNSSGNSTSKLIEVPLCVNGDIEVLPSIKLEVNRKILPPIKGFVAKDDNSPQKNKVTDKIYHDENPLGVDTFADRPKSASESVRKQLENSNNSVHMKKIGLRKNRTSPEENTNLFIFDPTTSQSATGKGSFSENSLKCVATRTDAVI